MKQPLTARDFGMLALFLCSVIPFYCYMMTGLVYWETLIYSDPPMMITRLALFLSDSTGLSKFWAAHMALIGPALFFIILFNVFGGKKWFRTKLFSNKSVEETFSR